MSLNNIKKYLVEKGFEVTKCNKNQHRILLKAQKNKNSNTIKFFIERDNSNNLNEYEYSVELVKEPLDVKCSRKYNSIKKIQSDLENTESKLYKKVITE